MKLREYLHIGHHVIPHGADHQRRDAFAIAHVVVGSSLQKEIDYLAVVLLDGEDQWGAHLVLVQLFVEQARVFVQDGRHCLCIAFADLTVQVFSGEVVAHFIEY